jgi:hypothetical protein
MEGTLNRRTSRGLAANVVQIAGYTVGLTVAIPGTVLVTSGMELKPSLPWIAGMVGGGFIIILIANLIAYRLETSSRPHSAGPDAQ